MKAVRSFGAFFGKLNLLIGAGLFFSSLGWSDIQGKLLINYEETPLVIKAGEPAHLTVDLFDPENPQGLHHFHPMHEKLMHLILISSDLQNFAHLHPEKMGEHTGLFGMEINKASAEFDNADAVRAAPFGGDYFVFAETMPMGYPMTLTPLSFKAEGPSNPVQVPLVPEPLAADGTFVKEQEGYQLQIKPGTYPHCGTFAVSLEIQLKQWSDTSRSYEAVKDLSPWLASFAHAVMISKAGQTVQEKVYYHLHAVWPLTDDPNGPKGPELRMTMDSNGPMSEGIFKFWLQFKHREKVHSVPFVIDVKAPKGPGLLQPSWINPLNLGC
jgi:hypothetical protein